MANVKKKIFLMLQEVQIMKEVATLQLSIQGLQIKQIT